MDMSQYSGSVFLKVASIKNSGPREVTVLDVEEGKFERPNLVFDDGSKLGLNATNCRTLVAAYGKDSDEWIGKVIKLTVGSIEYQGSAKEAVIVELVTPSIKKDDDGPKAGDGMDDEIPF
jgi:hypothetical protein